MTEEKAAHLCEQFKKKVAKIYQIPLELLESSFESWSESCKFCVKVPHVPEYYGWSVRYWMWENGHKPHWSLYFTLFGERGDHRTVFNYHFSGRGKIKVPEEMKWAAKECLKRMNKSG